MLSMSCNDYGGITCSVPWSVTSSLQKKMTKSKIGIFGTQFPPPDSDDADLDLTTLTRMTLTRMMLTRTTASHPLRLITMALRGPKRV